ncbi:hypothetical protein TraAM80_10183 [Trypanosoma rangeli]|uniref:Uncharacterized protein n=1 Tax=Trypanosoma rangeli TaxID=5698 RepID=A0A422MQV5_TRYRA|nr:uncharacterized protein TraAM80_10183 [Trypanosoma rangeli]RNE95580.1 hypothetical protein TraAM80_10183 [Trypanosoma rangeli]|eukprot:RNE95580.1 hypothetical protein TraAM80_10183 [Trypanosoma rangeli]
MLLQIPLRTRINKPQAGASDSQFNNQNRASPLWSTYGRGSGISGLRRAQRAVLAPAVNTEQIAGDNRSAPQDQYALKRAETQIKWKSPGTNQRTATRRTVPNSSKIDYTRPTATPYNMKW